MLASNHMATLVLSGPKNFIDIFIMKQTTASLLLLLLLLLLPCVLAATGSMAVYPNNKYVSTGKITVNTASTFNTSRTLAWSPLTFSITFPSGVQNQNSYIVALGLCDLRIIASSNRTQFTETTSSTNTAFTLLIYSSMANYIQRLSYRYLILAGTYISSGNIAKLSLTWTVNTNLTNASNYGGTLTLSPPLNMTGTIQTLCLVNGMEVTSTSLNTFSIELSATVNAATASFRLKSTTSIPTFVYNINFDFIAFNKGYYNQNNFANFYSGTISGTSGQTAMAYSNPNNCNNATLFGLMGFTIQTDAFVDFILDFGTSNSITITTANTANTLRSFSLQYITILTYYCTAATPYLYPISSVCYDICPIRTFTDSSTLVCKNCPYDCYTCDISGNCLTCNNVADFRYLNTSSSRCVPLSGYFQNSTTVCPKCAGSCLQCLSLTNCLNCSSATYLSSGICSACPSACLTCISSTQCQSCNQGYTLAANSLCYTTCSASQYLNISTASCQPCSDGCISCVSSTSCATCPSGYYSTMGVCGYCPTPCKTCLSSVYCYSCQTGYYLRPDKLCYSSCLVRTYAHSSFNCLTCPYDCYTCNSAGNCTSCNTADFRLLNSTTNRCVPITGYYDSLTTVCALCASGCETCLSAVVCTSCRQSYYLSSSSCPSCPTNCKTCLSSTYCYSCQTGFYMRPDRLCYSSCLVRTYADNSSFSCLVCPYDCYTCNSAGNCTSCSATDFRLLNSTINRCIPFEGYYDNLTAGCALCASSCQACLSATACSLCKQGYYLSNASCLSCPATCQSCLSSTYCLLCKSGNYLNPSFLCASQCAVGYYAQTSNSTCNVCSTACLTCSSFNTCTSCLPGAFLYNQICSSCLPGCMTCNSSTACLTCLAGYSKNLSGACASQCASNSYLNSSFICVPCSSICLTCSSNSSCTSCYPNYYFTNNSCYSCGKSQVLAPNLTCVNSCPFRYYIDSLFRTCQPCPYDCYTCDFAQKCLSCNETTDFRALNKQMGRCLPKTGYFDSSTTKSSACPSNCLICSSASSCSSCNIGAYLNNGVCSLCPNNCTSCLSSSYCMGCISGYYIRTDNLCYSSCPQRTYVQNFICVNCPYSCLTCDSSGKCLSCNTSDFRIFSNSQCVAIDGYFDNQVAVCVQCPAGCATCQSLTSCKTCNQSYYFDSAKCLQCPSNCLLCADANTCNSCNSDYSLNSGQCKVSSSSSSISSMPIGLIMGCALGGLLSLIIFCVHRKFKKPEPKNQRKQMFQEDPMHSTNCIRDQELSAESTENLWHGRARQISSQVDCSICLMQQCFFKTGCGHSFHLMCIMEWMKRKNTCPNCRELFTDKKHKIYCRKCHMQYKVIKVDKMKEMTTARSQEAETLCEDCKLVPL